MCMASCLNSTQTWIRNYRGKTDKPITMWKLFTAKNDKLASIFQLDSERQYIPYEVGLNQAKDKSGKEILLDYSFPEPKWYSFFTDPFNSEYQYPHLGEDYGIYCCPTKEILLEKWGQVCMINKTYTKIEVLPKDIIGASWDSTTLRFSKIFISNIEYERGLYGYYKKYEE